MIPLLNFICQVASHCHSYLCFQDNKTVRVLQRISRKHSLLDDCHKLLVLVPDACLWLGPPWLGLGLSLALISVSQEPFSLFHRGMHIGLV